MTMKNATSHQSKYLGPPTKPMQKANFIHESWYRGPQASFHPRKYNLKEDEAIKKWVLSGWLPNRPFIDKKVGITSFGSCFANNVSGFLKKRGYNVLDTDLRLQTGVIRFYEGMVNTFLIYEQLKWALEDKSTHLKFLDIIRNTDVFIITLGLTEVWYNKQTNEHMWKAVRKEEYDPKIHSFKISTFQENYNNLWKIHDLIRRTRPDAHIIFTLSPIPLKATFRPISCITANTVSKATLRTALDQILLDRQTDSKLHYFPSYEIVKEFFINPYRDDNTHVERELLKEIMLTFKKHYCI